jgi:hypothetical protein
MISQALNLYSPDSFDNEVQNIETSHALHLCSPDSFDNEVQNVEINGKKRLTLISAGTHDTEIEAI